VAPRWVAPFLAAFLVVAFAGSAVSDRAEQLSLVLYLPAFAALAVTVWRSPIQSWRSGVDGRVRTGISAAETVHEDQLITFTNPRAARPRVPPIRPSQGDPSRWKVGAGEPPPSLVMCHSVLADGRLAGSMALLCVVPATY
jgi:hypothetical protein